MKLKNQKPKHDVCTMQLVQFFYYDKGWIRPHLKVMLNKLKIMRRVQFLILRVLGPSSRKIFKNIQNISRDYLEGLCN
jgi:hypothetical protein